MGFRGVFRLAFNILLKVGSGQSHSSERKHKNSSIWPLSLTIDSPVPLALECQSSHSSPLTSHVTRHTPYARSRLDPVASGHRACNHSLVSSPWVGTPSLAPLCSHRAVNQTHFAWGPLSMLRTTWIVHLDRTACASHDRCPAEFFQQFQIERKNKIQTTRSQTKTLWFGSSLLP